MILGVMLNCDTQPEMMGAFLHAPLVNAMLKREKKGMHWPNKIAHVAAHSFAKESISQVGNR